LNDTTGLGSLSNVVEMVSRWYEPQSFAYLLAPVARHRGPQNFHEAKKEVLTGEKARPSDGFSPYYTLLLYRVFWPFPQPVHRNSLFEKSPRYTTVSVFPGSGLPSETCFPSYLLGKVKVPSPRVLTTPSLGCPVSTGEFIQMEAWWWENSACL
jgi:hypothetical protein